MLSAVEIFFVEKFPPLRKGKFTLQLPVISSYYKKTPRQTNGNLQRRKFAGRVNSTKKREFCMEKNLVPLVCWIIFVLPAVCADLNDGTTTTNHQACSNGTLTFTGDEALRKINMASITEVYWKARYSYNTKWKNIIYCRGSMACKVLTQVLPDGTRIQSSDNRTLTVQHSAGSDANDHSQFLFEVYLEDHSVARHIFKVNFTAMCIHTRIGANLNLTQVLLNKLPWKHVIDMEFFDVNGTKFSYCNTGQCTTEVNKIANNPKLNWVNRFDVTGGALVLTDIQKDDDCREIRVNVHLKSKGKLRRTSRSNMESVHVETIWILVNTSLGSPPPSSNDQVTDRFSSLSPSRPSVMSTLPSTAVPDWFAPTNPSDASAANGQLWTAIVIQLPLLLTFATLCDDGNIR